MFGQAKNLLDAIKAVNARGNAAAFLGGGIWIGAKSSRTDTDTVLRIPYCALGNETMKPIRTILIDFAACRTLAEMEPLPGAIRVVAFSAMLKLKCASTDPDDALMKLRVEYEQGDMHPAEYLASDERMKTLLEVLKNRNRKPDDTEHDERKSFGVTKNYCATRKIKDVAKHAYMPSKLKPVLGRLVAAAGNEAAPWVKFASGKQAAGQLGLNQGSVSACCRGKLKQTGGYEFKFDAQRPGSAAHPIDVDEN